MLKMTELTCKNMILAIAFKAGTIKPDDSDHDFDKLCLELFDLEFQAFRHVASHIKATYHVSKRKQSNEQ